jgi:hypothetical protein
MWSKLKSTFFEDLKIISLNHRLLIALSILVLIVIILPVCFPAVSHSAYLKTGVQPAKNYTLISLTLIALIPVIIGIAYGKIMSDEVQQKKNNDPGMINRNTPDSTYIRIFTSLTISFILVFLSIWFLKPVPSQGWLRTLYGAMLLSVQTSFVLLLIAGTGAKKIAGISLSIFYLVFLIALPFGLLVHHPWNYLAFFSPFYWIAWAWMIRPQVEAILCGSIAIILSSIVLFILLRYYLRRHSE